MDKKAILDKLLTKKGKDYTYAVAFFLIFSFFSFFIIRPNILAVFQANLQIENLKKTNAFYETQIQNVINAQTILVDARDDLSLLDQAVPSKPQVNSLIFDITNVADEDDLEIASMNLIDVNLKDTITSAELKTIIFNIGINGGFDNYLKLIRTLYAQRRLKLLKNIDIARVLEKSSASAELKMNFQLEGYYL